MDSHAIIAVLTVVVMIVISCVSCCLEILLLRLLRKRRVLGNKAKPSIFHSFKIGICFSVFGIAFVGLGLFVPMIILDAVCNNYKIETHLRRLALFAWALPTMILFVKAFNKKTTH
jgi:hypothetical protein